MSRPGTVYLVGAGPGDPALLTVRALDLVRQADIVLHDHLVSPEILAHCGSHTRLVDVGKVGYGPQTDQTAIERQLIAFARRGCRVVRLKGGDPFLFGRGSEEASALRAANVPFEIVPGVSSALAAPAYAGIPLTARGLAASVAIVTGHCGGSGATPATIPIADTIVVLMGIANAASIRDQWLAAGRCPDTPAAVIEWGTCAQQRVAVATVATLPDVIARACLQAPAVIVIGETVRLRSVLDWFDSSSLDGRDVAPRRRSEHRQRGPARPEIGPREIAPRESSEGASERRRPHRAADVSCARSPDLAHASSNGANTSRGAARQP